MTVIPSVRLGSGRRAMSASPRAAVVLRSDGQHQAPPLPPPSHVPNENATTATPGTAANRFTLNDAFIRSQKEEEARTAMQVEALSTLSGEVVWKNLALHRRQSFNKQSEVPQSSDEATTLGASSSDNMVKKRNELRPGSSSGAHRAPHPPLQRQLSKESSISSQGGEGGDLDSGRGVIADLRTLAAKFAHQVDVKRANVTQFGVSVPLSFSVKPPPTAATSGALGRRRTSSRVSSLSHNVEASSPRSTTGGTEGGSRVPSAAIRSNGHQVVTSLVVPSKLPVASSVTSYLVPYERQGNVEFYTDSSKKSRAELREHHLVVDVLEQLWNALPKTVPSGSYVNVEMFRWLHRKVYYHFCSADANEHVWAQVAYEDWKTYGGSLPGGESTTKTAPLSGGGRRSSLSAAAAATSSTEASAAATEDGGTVLMRQTGCDNFMFAFIDVWSQSLDVDEYVALGKEALHVILHEGDPYSGPVSETEAAIEAELKALQQQASVATVGNHQSRGGLSKEESLAASSSGSPSKTGSQKNSVEPPWTKEMVTEAAEMRSLQAVAAAQQTVKVVDALSSMGKADLSVTEVQQLQGFVRVVCDIEEREEDELRRLAGWATAFVEDAVDKCWWLLTDDGSSSPSPCASPTSSHASTTGASSTSAASLATSIRELQHVLALHSSSVADFSDSEGSDRRNVVTAVAKLLNVVASAVAERRPIGDGEEVNVSDVRKKISVHWKSGSSEKRKLRASLQRTIEELKAAFEPALSRSTAPQTQQNGRAPVAPAVPSAANVPQPGTAEDNVGGHSSMLSVAARSVSPEERNMGLMLLRELQEMSRHADLDIARAQESTTLVEFLSTELAAQRPITALMENALGDAQRLSATASRRQVRVGSSEWKQHIQSLSRVEVGLYHVVDAIHQELQNSVAAIVESCEATVTRALADDNGTRFNRFPMHLTQRIDQERDLVVARCKEQRDAASKSISDLRLFSNEYFTKVCPEEKGALAQCLTEADIRHALMIRDQLGTVTQVDQASVKSASSSPSPTRADQERAHALAMHVAAAGLMQKSHALQVPVSTFLRPSWFVTVNEKGPNGAPQQQVATYCATQLFPFLQQRNVAWSCTLLGELMEVVNTTTTALQSVRVEVENSLQEILGEAESLAMNALLPSNAADGAADSWRGRRRCDRDGWNVAVDRSCIAHLQETIRRLVSVPQSMMTAQHEYFLRKTYEWVERRWESESEAVQLHSTAAAVKKKSELDRLDWAGRAISDVNNELDRVDNVVLALQVGALDTMRSDEEAQLQWMRDKRDQRIQAERRVRIIKAAEGGALTPREMSHKVVTLAAEQRNAAAQAVLQRFAGCAKAAIAPPGPLLPVESLLDAPAVDPVPSSVSTSMARWLLASHVVKRWADGSVTAAFRAHPAVEKRRALYIKNKLSNVDVLVTECTKRGAAIPDSIRHQLSVKPAVYDALVLPLLCTPKIGGGVSLVDVLGDFLWLNPLQYVCLQQCSLENSDVELLSKLLSGHPTINFVDLRHNSHITDDKPIIRLLDVNRSSLMYVAVGHGTGIPAQAIREVEKTCLQHRKERKGLQAHEALLMASHFEVLKDPKDKKVSHCSTAAVALENKRRMHRQGSRGCASHPMAALQGIVAVFVAEHQPATEAWTVPEFIKALFPSWGPEKVQEAIESFTAS